MRRWLLIPVGVAVLALAALWLTGATDGLARWAAEGQREFQGAMARALRALKGGEPGALAWLIGLCFAYGFFHAVGPGHGKILIGGYGMGRRVPMGRLVALAVISSLAQAASAVALVYLGVALLDWSRETVTDIADTTLETVSYAAIGAIGLWLLARGLRTLWRRLSPDTAVAVAAHSPAGGGHGGSGAPHAHSHGRGTSCDVCGHAHGPSLEEVAGVRSLRDAVLLVAGIAVRPCTGALFVLILTWRLGIEAAGIAGAFAMGLGTASVTVAVAVAAVSMREGTLIALGDSRVARLLIPTLEAGAGALVALVAAQLLVRGL